MNKDLHPLIGRRVRLSAPSYAALNPADDSVVIRGTLVAIARRENGRHAGVQYDAVVNSGHRWHTISISRIVNAVALDEV